jgi:hypothetical protein
MLTDFARRIHDQVYKRFYDYKTTLFLCGAGGKSGKSVRDQISDALTKGWYAYQYDIFYPEDLFDELLYGPGHQDLITLENILAASVDAVVLVVESYGAVAELGAFASNSILRKKLVCVVNARYKKDKSFINYGPIRLMRDKREGAIVYIDYAKVTEGLELIRRAASKVRKATPKSVDVTNVVQAHNFILPCIYLLEPIPRDTLVELVRNASGADVRVSSAVTAGALSILNKHREIMLTPNGYKLTPAGMIRFTNLGKRGSTRHAFDISSLDEMRIAVLNWKLRGKRLRI